MNDIINLLLLKAGIPLAFLILGYLAGRFIKPWLEAKPGRLAKAREIALIADRVTDEMRLLAPAAHWSEWIDEAVDRVIAACGLPDADDARAIAHREIASQILKKGFIGVTR
ncbi:hypothetical protein DRQ36_06560 [bacterium]|nr:MAG: hypothetical protein DRQ36_06560 [bacterium]